MQADPQDRLTEDELQIEEADVKDLRNIDDFSEGEDTRSRTFAISSYGADYTVDSLVARMQKGDFFVPPFQRSFVWNIRQSSRFIESLLMGLPVPGIFVFREAGTNRHLIIDGQQRLKTLSYYYKGVFEKKQSDEKAKSEVFGLRDVRDPWNGATYESLDDADKRRLDDSIIHTTIFRQEAPNNDDSVYEVFERINTGGVKLSPQEIRVCVNFGPFTNLIAKVNEDIQWRRIYGPYSPRLKDQELVLRFFAFSENLETYRRPLRSFLNRYMEANRQVNDYQGADLANNFSRAINAIYSSIGRKAFRPERALNTAVFDAVSVAVGRRLTANPQYDSHKLKNAYDALLANPDFQKTYTRATADEENVKERFALAITAFWDV